MTLKQYIRNPVTRKPHRGALSRVSEHLNVSYNTVKRWYSGEWKPGLAMARRIQDMIHARIPIAAKKRTVVKRRKSAGCKRAKK